MTMFKLTVPSLILCFSILHPLMKAGADDPGIITKVPESAIPAAELLYRQIGEPELPLTALKSAMTVYEALAEKGQITNKNVITLIDFSQPSCKERLFVIDLDSKQILFKSLVAHGKNSGENYATSFSNNIQSHQSSPGFYLTGNPYQGSHGYSLTLKGLEKGINDNAWKRSVVIHGAPYVSEEYIEAFGRLGRSFGCPALPLEKASEIIDTIRDGSLLFIYTKDKDYCRNSRFFNSFLSRP
jgi:hypothetical protein